MDILKLDDPTRLREVIDHWGRVNAPENRTLAVAEATRFAGGNAWLLGADRWVRQTAVMIAQGLTLHGLTAQSDPRGGIRRMPDPGRALIITPHGLSSWRYVNDEPTREVGKRGHCDRCAPLPGDPSRPSTWDTCIAAIFHVPADMFVIELALCQECSVSLAALAKTVTERSRIDAGETYVEFERSARIGPKDEPEV